jgi:hypothetical protein
MTLNKLSKQYLLLLFLMAAFPIHFWSIISQLWQYGNGKGFFERGAYSLTFALFESIVVTLILWIFSLFLPRRWGEKRILALIGLVYWVVAFWGMVGQIYFMLNLSEGTFLYRAFGYVGRHPWPFFITFMLGILISILLPPWFILRSEKFTNTTIAFIERIAVLSGVYLFLDLVGVLAVITWSL